VVDRVCERIDLARHKAAIGLPQRNKEVHILPELEEILGIRRPAFIVLWLARSWGPTRILFCPGPVEAESGPRVGEVDANKEIVIALAKNGKE